jgi:hypothetical protein
MNNCKPDTLYEPLTEGFSTEKCFLCGTCLDDLNKTKEHIFPQWMINHFNLGTKTLGLQFQRKEVRYRQITIPCCKVCNSSALAPLERRVRHNFIELKDDEFDLTDKEIALWAGKVYYGILLYDYFDAIADNFDPQGIQYLKSFFEEGDVKILHIFLQSLVKPVFIKCYDKDFPVSVIHYRTQLPLHVNNQFNFKTWPLGNSLYFRIGRRGFLICFDAGYLTKYKGFDFWKYQDKRLHPLQLAELAAHFFNLSQLRCNNRSYLRRLIDNNIYIDYFPDNFSRWYDDNPDEKGLVKLLCFTTGFSREVIVREQGIVTYLRNETGDFFRMTLKTSVMTRYSNLFSKNRRGVQ